MPPGMSTPMPLGIFIFYIGLLTDSFNLVAQFLVHMASYFMTGPLPRVKSLQL